MAGGGGRGSVAQVASAAVYQHLLVLLVLLVPLKLEKHLPLLDEYLLAVIGGVDVLLDDRPVC